jgi:hypothetical protein
MRKNNLHENFPKENLGEKKKGELWGFSVTQIREIIQKKIANFVYNFAVGNQQYGRMCRFFKKLS